MDREPNDNSSAVVTRKPTNDSSSAVVTRKPTTAREYNNHSSADAMSLVFQ